MRQNANGASRLKNTARTTRACSRAQEGQMTAARTKQNGKQRKRHRKKREVNLQQDKKKYYLVYIKMYRYVCMILKAAIVAYIASRLLCTRYRVYVSPAERIVTRLVVGRDALKQQLGQDVEKARDQPVNVHNLQNRQRRECRWQGERQHDQSKNDLHTRAPG